MYNSSSTTTLGRILEVAVYAAILCVTFLLPAQVQADSWTIDYSVHTGTGVTSGTDYYSLLYSPTPTATLSASPSTIDSGNSAVLTWSSTGAASCTGSGTGFSTGSATSGSDSVSPTVTTTYTVTCGTASANATVTVLNRSNLTAGTVITSPTSPTIGSAATLSSTISNSGTASSGTGFHVLFQQATDSSGSNTDDIGTYYRSTALSNGSTFSASLSYIFTSSGTKYLRACADKLNVSDSGIINESNESDNCSVWVAVIVGGSGAALSASCIASPNPADVNQNTTWTSTVSGGSGIYLYNWTGTDGLTGTTANVTKAYSTVGTKNASVTVTSINSYDFVLTRDETTDIPEWCIDTGGSPCQQSSTCTFACSAGTEGNSCAAEYCIEYGFVWWKCTKEFQCQAQGTDTTAQCANLTVSDIPECSDGVNNDGDSYGADYPNDPGCSDSMDNTESPNPQCSDGVNNSDADGLIDCADSGCWTTPGNPATCDLRDSTEDPNPPTITFACTNPSPCTVTPGGPATLTWSSSGYASCNGSGFNTGGATSGSVVVNPTVTTPYGLTCGSTSAPPATVTVQQAVTSISASPDRVNTGGTSQITFSATNVLTSCTVTGTDGYSSGAIAQVGGAVGPTTINRTINTQTTYTISCDSGSGTALDSVVVNVNPSFEEF